MTPGFTDPPADVHGVPKGRVTVLRGADCSHGEQAIRAIKRLADEVCLRVDVDDIIVGTDDEARARGCQGSPTILIEARDIEPEARGATSFGIT